LVKKPLGPIGEAILIALGNRQMTRYELWSKARAVHPTLSPSQVYEYLRGQRDIGGAAVEALMAAARPKMTSSKPRASSKLQPIRWKRKPTRIWECPGSQLGST
jgi:hypothetical protein